VWLGYRDSGMPGTPENEHPACFANAPFDDVVGRLVAILRRERPHVVITYPDVQDGYQHPDHLRVFDVTVAAVRGAASPTAFPWAGTPWDVPKLYYTMWTRARMQATHQKIVELGMESPYDDSWFNRPWQDFRVTTSVDISSVWDRRKAALLSHATQIDPASPFWFALPDEVARTVHPYEEYHLARSNVPVELPETDVFAGLRATVDA
jgi:mycothiol S-conjugate amidase